MSLDISNGEKKIALTKPCRRKEGSQCPLNPAKKNFWSKNQLCNRLRGIAYQNINRTYNSIYTHYTVDLNDLVDKGVNHDKHPEQLPSPFLPQDVELLMQDPT